MTTPSKYPISPEAPEYGGREVVDDDGNKIGKVTDVVYDSATMVPQWVIVDLGRLRAEHYVPLHHVHESEDGRLVIPFDKETVKQAPRAPCAHVLTRAEEEQLREHYGIAV